MKRSLWCLCAATACVVVWAVVSTQPGMAEDGKKQADIGVPRGELSPAIDNPYVPFAKWKRAVYAGKEIEDGETIQVRVESTVSAAPQTVAGISVTVVQVRDFDGDELVENTEDYYAQHASGAVYYIGERVDDLEDGKIVGHGGQWLAGEQGAKAGVFMPSAPKLGDVFEQERAPGVAEDRSTVVAVGSSVSVPAGTYTDCIEVEDYDPIGKTKQRKFYCSGVGLVKEIFADGGSIELIELETR